MSVLPWRRATVIKPPTGHAEHSSEWWQQRRRHQAWKQPRQPTHSLGGRRQQRSENANDRRPIARRASWLAAGLDRPRSSLARGFEAAHAHCVLEAPLGLRATSTSKTTQGEKHLLG